MEVSRVWCAKQSARRSRKIKSYFNYSQTEKGTTKHKSKTIADKGTGENTGFKYWADNQGETETGVELINYSGQLTRQDDGNTEN